MFDFIVIVVVAATCLWVGHHYDTKGLSGFVPGGKSGRDTIDNKH